MHLELGPVWGGWDFSKEIIYRPIVYFHLPWWHFVIGRWEDRLFSERHGFVWCKRIGKLRLTIRRMKAHV